MALHSLYCADVPFRNWSSLAHSFLYWKYVTKKSSNQASVLENQPTGAAFWLVYTKTWSGHTPSRTL